MFEAQKKTGFVYSAYWGIWLRLLGITKHGVAMMLELTPINGDYNTARKEVIRRGAMPLGEIHDKLPDEVHIELEKQFGKIHSDRLLCFDYLSNIDWEKHTHHTNGGCEFFLCQNHEGDSREFATWQQACHTRNSAIRYLANKPNSYVMFFQLPWENNAGCLSATTVSFSIVNITDRGFWEVHRKDAESIRFHSVEQTIAFITHKWW